MGIKHKQINYARKSTDNCCMPSCVFTKWQTCIVQSMATQSLETKKKEVKKVAIFGITANDDEHCMKW